MLSQLHHFYCFLQLVAEKRAFWEVATFCCKTMRPCPKLVSLHANLTPPNAVVFELDHPYMVASKRSCIQQPQQSLQQPRQPQWQPRKQRQHQRPDNNDEVSKVPGETHVKVLSVVCEAHFHVSSFLFPSTSRGC